MHGAEKFAVRTFPIAKQPADFAVKEKRRGIRGARLFGFDEHLTNGATDCCSVCAKAGHPFFESKEKSGTRLVMASREGLERSPSDHFRIALLPRNFSDKYIKAGSIGVEATSVGNGVEGTLHTPFIARTDRLVDQLQGLDPLLVRNRDGARCSRIDSLAEPTAPKSISRRRGQACRHQTAPKQRAKRPLTPPRGVARGAAAYHELGRRAFQGRKNPLGST